MGDLRPCNISSDRATQNKQDGIIYNCQKQSVHKLWPIKYHWFTENFPNIKFYKVVTQKPYNTRGQKWVWINNF